MWRNNFIRPWSCRLGTQALLNLILSDKVAHLKLIRQLAFQIDAFSLKSGLTLDVHASACCCTSLLGEAASPSCSPDSSISGRPSQLLNNGGWRHGDRTFNLKPQVLWATDAPMSEADALASTVCTWKKLSRVLQSVDGDLVG